MEAEVNVHFEELMSKGVSAELLLTHQLRRLQVSLIWIQHARCGCSAFLEMILLRASSTLMVFLPPLS